MRDKRSWKNTALKFLENLGASTLGRRVNDLLFLE
jgi:hypothetical protein